MGGDTGTLYQATAIRQMSIAQVGLSAGYDYGLSSLDSGNRFDAQNRVIKVGANFSF